MILVGSSSTNTSVSGESPSLVSVTVTVCTTSLRIEENVDVVPLVAWVEMSTSVLGRRMMIDAVSVAPTDWPSGAMASTAAVTVVSSEMGELTQS